MFNGMNSPGTAFTRLVIGIGNDYRGDDAAGFVVSRKLAELKLSDIEIIESNGDSADPTGRMLGKAQIYRAPDANLNSLHLSTVANLGGSQAHLNMQPFLTLSFCIALQGIFPSQT